MSFNLPYPGQPANTSPGVSQPVRDNFTAIAQAMNSFDGTQIQPNTIQESALTDDINPRLRGSETIPNFVYSGCTWSQLSGLNGTMTGGTIYVNGYRRIVNPVGTKVFTASRDTYVDIDYLGNVAYQEVTNNAASPSLTANSVRVAIVITDGSGMTFINQGQTNTALTNFGPTINGAKIAVSDTSGSLIYPQSGQRVIGFAQITSSVNTTSTSRVQVPGLSMTIRIPTPQQKVKLQFYSTSAEAASAVSVFGFYDGPVANNVRLQQANQPPAGGHVNLESTPLAFGPGVKTINLGFSTTNAASACGIAADPEFPAYIEARMA